MKKVIAIRKYHRAIDDEFYSEDATCYDTFEEIIKAFGKKNCIKRGKRLFVFKENSILMYERADSKCKYPIEK